VLRTDPTPEDYAKVLERLKKPGMLRLLPAIMGIGTEAGELMELLKKHLFYGKELDLINAKEELGDEMWYVGLATDVINTAMDEVMEMNISKLKKRYPEKFTEHAALNRDKEKELSHIGSRKYPHQYIMVNGRQMQYSVLDDQYVDYLGTYWKYTREGDNVLVHSHNSRLKGVPVDEDVFMAAGNLPLFVILAGTDTILAHNKAAVKYLEIGNVFSVNYKVSSGVVSVYEPKGEHNDIHKYELTPLSVDDPLVDVLLKTLKK
jgi:NTP pyrophosphatase (non-canonical NTP hydrolase)